MAITTNSSTSVKSLQTKISALLRVLCASALKLCATAVTNRNRLKCSDDFAVAALENKV